MNILIIRVSSIGDVIHTLPAIFLLKACVPQARITWIVQEKAASLIVNQPFLDRVVVIPNRFFMPGAFAKTAGLVNELRATRWDAIIDFQGLIKTSLLLFSLRGKKYGFDWKNARESVSSLLTHQHTAPVYKNIIQKNLALVSDVIYDLVGPTSCPTIDTLQKSFYIQTPTDKKNVVDSWLQKNSLTNVIALCPNTTWESKRWPSEHWNELAKKLANTMPERQLVLMGKDFGADAKAVAEYAAQHRLPVHILPSWDLATTTYFLQKVSLLIAPDTSFLHLADFLGVPAIGLFGPTSKLRHGPFLFTPNIARAIQVPCPHVYQKSHGTENCMQQLSAADLAQAIHRLPFSCQKNAPSVS